jgi:hypothetical protein
MHSIPTGRHRNYTHLRKRASLNCTSDPIKCPIINELLLTIAY